MANSLQGQVTVTHVQNNGGAQGQDAQHHHRDLLQVQINVMVEFGMMSSPAMAHVKLSNWQTTIYVIRALSKSPVLESSKNGGGTM